MQATADQMYEVMRELFDAFLEDEKMVATARKTNAVLCYRFTNPTVRVIINNRADPPVVIYGDSDVSPDVTISMPWDVAHEFLMGRANAADLFLKKKLTVQPMSQAMKYLKLVPMFMSLLKRYPEIIEQKGLTEAMEGR
ncbi:MAG: SCP2 sterol-binding domain-containing protein [Actinobacteria bacterium]|nr:SCP2 sterol-binding domain-containing protein [Actinomycetota bacterium]MBU1945089.1 SCP2 sterol-binding domain-containing protein [Actinomycetota bacterium]MBU2688358.1 SCP2 sterol-binding domain-containing protein [Actinomycetota bacterium]